VYYSYGIGHGWLIGCEKIMKTFFIFLLVAWPAFASGQSDAEISKRLKLLVTRPSPKYDTSGMSSLPKFNYRCNNENKFAAEFFHVVDLNDDGLSDIVYSGPCGGNYQTGIFLNIGKAFKKIYDYPGQVIFVEKDSVSTAVNILKEASACDFYSQYIQVRVDRKSQLAKNTIVFGAKTKISVANRFRKDKVVGTLRTTPHINDVVKRDECNNAVRGNQLTRISEFKDIVQLNRFGPWWLVLYPESNERSWIGWMKLN
jgi:hypothetical protein